jgi:alpha-N-arabinofuranosidase
MRNWLLLTGLLAFSFACADDNAHAPIYLDYPVGAWADWSWATRNMRSTTQVHSHQYAIQVNMTAWTAIRFRHENGGFNTQGFTHLEFWVHGGPTGGQQFSIRATVNYVDRTPVPITNYLTIAPNTWHRVQVPLSALQAQNVPNLTDIHFVEQRGQSVPVFWIDSVRLLKSPPGYNANVQVHAGNRLRTLSPLMFGINTAAWDWNLNISGTRERLKEGGFTVLRFPGGSTSNEYDWQNNRNRRTNTSYGTNTAGFINAANSCGAEKMITINYGSGTPQEARNWVQYANVTLNGNVRYWQIGNECYGTWEYDTHPNRHDADTYARFVRDAIALMKAVDPNIKVGVVGTWSETDWTQRFSVQNPRTGQTVNGWSAVLLKTLRDLNVTPDFYDVHYYPNPAGRENDTHLLQSTREWAGILNASRQLLRDYLGEVGESVPVYITENNAVSTSPGKQTTGLVNALYLADSFGQVCLNGAEAFVWWDLHNGVETGNNNSPTLYGWRNYGDYGALSAGSQGGVGDPLNSPYPVFHAFKLLKQFARPGDTLVQVNSDNELLSVYAVRSAEGRRLRLLVINKSAAQDIQALLRFSRFMPRGYANVYTYGIPQDQARKEFSRSRVRTTTPTMRIRFPKLSVSVVDIQD